MKPITRITFLFAAMSCALLMGPVQGQELAFIDGVVISDEAALPGAADPGGAASKGKLMRLVKTPNGAHDGRLVVVWSDAHNANPIWNRNSFEHLPRDIFARFSDDEGATWSDPVNISGTARHFSARADWDGDGQPEIYWGDSGKPTVFNNGDNIVVSWTDKYVPEASWAWGDDGESSIQGKVSYPDLAVPTLQREVPFSGLYLAISVDGGDTWRHGVEQPPLQMTFGRRDALQDVVRGIGKRWVVTWQEDPEGLQPGEADGPGDGASGAKTTKGTDIWYACTDDITVDALALCTNRTPLSNNSSYDVTGANGFPVTQLGMENRAASRANLMLVKEGAGFTAVVAYEETKGVPDLLEGKTIRYHAFPDDAPVRLGTDGDRYGDAGVSLTDIMMNSRRVRFVTQPPNGVHPAIALIWKQGLTTEGGPSDIMLKLSRSLDVGDVAAAPILNLSTQTPTANDSTLLFDSEVDPLEDARAHRALLRGDMLVVGYSYTWNGPLARYTDMANYDFWIRRTLDGGTTWLAPQEVSDLEGTAINVKEPRLVGPSKTGTQDDDAFVIAWGTETNVYEGLELATPLDIMITRTFDQGATFEPVVPMAMADTEEFESQLRTTDDVSTVAAVWMDSDGTVADVMFGWSSPWQDLGYALAGVNGEPTLRGDGPLAPNTPAEVRLRDAAPVALVAFLLSGEMNPTPFRGGILVPIPFIDVVTGFTNGTGGYTVPFQWPGIAVEGDAFVTQVIVADNHAIKNYAFSNALRGTSR